MLVVYSLLLLSVCCQPAVLPESCQHPDGEIPPQPPRHQQHPGGKLQQPSLAEERGGAHLPRRAENLRRLPDIFCWEISQPGECGLLREAATLEGGFSSLFFCNHLESGLFTSSDYTQKEINFLLVMNLPRNVYQPVQKL